MQCYCAGVKCRNTSNVFLKHFCNKRQNLRLFSRPLIKRTFLVSSIILRVIAEKAVRALSRTGMANRESSRRQSARSRTVLSATDTQPTLGGPFKVVQGRSRDARSLDSRNLARNELVPPGRADLRQEKKASGCVAENAKALLHYYFPLSSLPLPRLHSCIPCNFFLPSEHPFSRFLFIPPTDTYKRAA